LQHRALYHSSQLVNCVVLCIVCVLMCTVLLPHILCLSEHHLSESKLQLIHLTKYSLGANYCRKTFLKGGISIFVYRNLKYKTINIMSTIKIRTLKFVQSNWTQHLINYAFWLFIDLQGVILQISLNN